VRVRALDSNDDWTFGKGRANYLTGTRAIAQNVKTRLRSFKNDWFLDVDHGVDWFELLGNLGTQRRLVRAVEKTVLETEGVVTVSRIEVIRIDVNRKATIEVDYKDVYNTEQSETLTI
jgi:hypothetical protein